MTNLEDDDKLLKDDPNTIIHIILLAWRNKIENHKALKNISKELMSVAWHLKTWWDWCFSENGKKK